MFLINNVCNKESINPSLKYDQGMEYTKSNMEVERGLLNIVQ
jgi:hypothetical protein